MPSDLMLPILDPTAPLPGYWPTGAWGAFLLFLIPIGGGIPLGVLMGRDAGVSPLTMSGMYFVSDIFMALTHEPIFWVLGALANAVPVLGKVRDFFARASGAAGLRDEGAHGPLGLILFSFTVDPVSARGAAAAAGHGFIVGWSLAVAGDMLYFGVLMAATLWLSGILGDEQSTVGIVLLSIWGLSWLIRRRHGARKRVDDAESATRSGGPAVLQPAPVPVAADLPTVTSIRLRPPRPSSPTATRPPAARKKAGRKRSSR
ncbi:MAG: hypothetical protein AB7P40_08935 [Chloroflexota bacterium]